MATTTTTSTTTATTTTSQESSDYRVCTISSCRKRMSTLKHDKHLICISCRNVKCDLDIRCKECESWSTDVMKDYLRHRKSLESKTKKPAKTIEPPQSETTKTDASLESRTAELVDQKMQHFQQEITRNVSSMFEAFMSKFSNINVPVSGARSDKTANNDCLSAPPLLTQHTIRCGSGLGDASVKPSGVEVGVRTSGQGVRGPLSPPILSGTIPGIPAGQAVNDIESDTVVSLELDRRPERELGTMAVPPIPSNLVTPSLSNLVAPSSVSPDSLLFPFSTHNAPAVPLPTPVTPLPVTSSSLPPGTPAFPHHPTPHPPSSAVTLPPPLTSPISVATPAPASAPVPLPVPPTPASSSTFATTTPHSASNQGLADYMPQYLDYLRGIDPWLGFVSITSIT